MADVSDSPITVPEVIGPDYTGRSLGDFLLDRRLGQGGMGQVYLARQTSLKRDVAVKILKPELAANEIALKRFRAEAEAVARITHANIVQVYAIGETDGIHYMALEYVEGRTLKDLIRKKGTLELPAALAIMRQTIAALQRAGEMGFVHRDIKPENILLTRNGEVKVADFGLSRAFGEVPQAVHLTQSGVTMGTPLYMSPEQVQGHAVDPRSDIYSFGVTCYHMLAGEPPFQGKTPFEVAVQHVQNEPIPLNVRRPDLPAEVCAIVMRMMAKNPAERYQSAREVLRDLNRLRDGLPLPVGVPNPLAVSGTQVSPLPMKRSRRGWFVMVGMVLTGAAGAAVHQRRMVSAGPVERPDDVLPTDPLKTRERDLLQHLQQPSGNDDPLDALAELTALYCHERRFDEALAIFDESALRKRPALMEITRSMNMPKEVIFKESSRARDEWFAFVAELGKAVVWSGMDRAKESVDLFQKTLPPSTATVKNPRTLRNTLADLFFRRHKQWRKLVADALDRNAKNQNLTQFNDERLNRYRSYTKMP